MDPGVVLVTVPLHAERILRGELWGEETVEGEGEKHVGTEKKEQEDEEVKNGIKRKMSWVERMEKGRWIRESA